MTSGPGTPDYAIATGVLSRRVDDEMVLLNTTSEQYYALDAVGADIVGRITTQPLHEAVASLTRDYEVRLDVLRSDVDRLVGDLREAGLLEPARREP